MTAINEEVKDHDNIEKKAVSIERMTRKGREIHTGYSEEVDDDTAEGVGRR